MYGPSKYGFFINLIREFFVILDSMVYMVISGIYQVFFNVANSTLISGEVIKQFFSRVQLILGIVILFKLAITLMSGIINPDSIANEKTGFSKIITRVITALIMLVLIVPLNIPEEAITNGSYESQLNNNGILFGTMYEFQSRILSQNTLAKLILNKDISTAETSSNESIADAGSDLSSTILKTFITVNLASEEVEKNISSTEDYLEPSNRMCQDIDSNDAVADYLTTNNYRTLLNLTSFKCGSHFTFNYSFLISTIVGVLFIIVMVGFTLDMAIRALKLAILRLIAPVPIISYIDPKTESAFSNWSKTLINTYVDLFIRVAIVYFIIFCIDSFIHTGIIINNTSGPIWFFSLLFILLGLFFFAKEAPKFITDSLGIKESKGFFKGIGKMFGAASVAKGGISSAMAGWNASKESQEARGVKRNYISNAGSAITNAISGMKTGASALNKAENHRSRAVRDAIRSQNEQVLETGRQGASFLGTMQDRIRLATGRETRSTVNDSIMAANKRFAELYDKAAAKADVIDDALTAAYEFKDSTGRTISGTITGGAKTLKERLERLKASGTATEDEIAEAEARYKAVQAKTIEAHIASGDKNDLIYQYYEQAKTISESQPEILDTGTVDPLTGLPIKYNLTSAKDFKFAHFKALDINSSMEFGTGSGAYNAAKADATRAKNKNK